MGVALLQVSHFELSNFIVLYIEFELQLGHLVTLLSNSSH
jgi:hypothetical protein